jgi:hypothetical protein
LPFPGEGVQVADEVVTAAHNVVVCEALPDVPVILKS